MAARVLIIEDDQMLGDVLANYVGSAGHQVSVVHDGAEAYASWQREPPDVVLLDVMLPTLSGLEVLRRRRAAGDRAAVIIISARGDEQDRLIGLEVGADDYVVKPLSPREIVLRIEALLRRAEQLGGAKLLDRTLRVADLEIDQAARIVTRDGNQVNLTSREFDLLAFLAGHPGETFSKSALMHRVWGWDFGDNSTVTVHVRRLRQKVEDDPSEPKLVLTVGREGYRVAREDELR
ncbi:response regulator transcription factor [Microlunatus soli]|uniref:DNA-binding response regulator, OmpR family, contains REC and winged-helix (WHTH) domain n=1 Tax=Microlunatus soli TaxID=630515 RepID=A0A1H1YQW3_9ACTN|nr:response regulator transcription factor [Microlunatus soli]SDT23787.1 DNA-binding response regulator, OmpR family, contains REC and winged-helix (wHTH) domain [Microlunatus soli]